MYWEEEGKEAGKKVRKGQTGGFESPGVPKNRWAQPGSALAPGNGLAAARQSGYEADRYGLFHPVKQQREKPAWNEGESQKRIAKELAALQRAQASGQGNGVAAAGRQGFTVDEQGRCTSTFQER